MNAMPRKKTTAARYARALQRATGQKYTAALRAVRQDTPEAALASALRRAGLSDEADYLAELDRDRTRAISDPDPGDDYLVIEWEQVLIESVFAALVTAAARADAVFLVAAAADVLDTLDPGFTADIIRGQEFGDVPALLVDTAPTRLAHQAAQALLDATHIRHHRDQEWVACITLIEHARDLARQAATPE